MPIGQNITAKLKSERAAHLIQKFNLKKGDRLLLNSATLFGLLALPGKANKTAKVSYSPNRMR